MLVYANMRHFFPTTVLLVMGIAAVAAHAHDTDRRPTKSVAFVGGGGKSLHARVGTQFVDRTALKQAVEEWCLGSATATTTYGDITAWDVRTHI